MRWRIKTVLAVAILGISFLFTTAFDAAYDPVKKEEIKQNFPLPTWPRYSFPLVEVRGTAWALVNDNKGQWIKEFVYWGQQGSGTVVKDGYVLTAAHVVIPKRVLVHTSQHGAIDTWPYKIESTQIFLRVDSRCLIPAWIDYVDQDADIAILAYVPNKVLEPINIEVALDPEKLHRGDTIAIVTHERDKEGRMIASELRVIYGQIADKHIEAPFPEIMLNLHPGDFTMHVAALPGDSGTAVFAFENHKPYLIGWLHSGYQFYPLVYIYAGWLADYERFFHVR